MTILVCSYTADSFQSGDTERKVRGQEVGKCALEKTVYSVDLVRKTWVHILTLPFASFVTLRKLLNISEPQFF